MPKSRLESKEYNSYKERICCRMKVLYGNSLVNVAQNSSGDLRKPSGDQVDKLKDKFGESDEWKRNKCSDDTVIGQKQANVCSYVVLKWDIYPCSLEKYYKRVYCKKSMNTAQSNSIYHKKPSDGLLDISEK
jgi:hypothetical protein